eukprot:3941388-Rhodomonas_salina.5
MRCADLAYGPMRCTVLTLCMLLPALLDARHAKKVLNPKPSRARPRAVLSYGFSSALRLRASRRTGGTAVLS